MLLDAVLLNLDNVWMSSRDEKVDYFSKRGIATDDYPHRTVQRGEQQLVRPFPDLLPIGRRRVHDPGHLAVVEHDDAVGHEHQLVDVLGHHEHPGAR